MSNAIADFIDLQRNHGRAVIAGAEFDFSHPDLGADWKPASLLGLQGDSFTYPTIGPPRWCFPWTRLTENPALVERGKLNGRKLLRHIVAYGPDGWVRVGDKVYIDRVKPVHVGNLFDVEPDAWAMHVRFAVVRADGRTERLKGKLVYLHRDRHWGEATGGDGGDFWFEGLDLAAVERRVGYLFANGDIDVEGNLTDRCEPNAAACWKAIGQAGLQVESEFDRAWRDRSLVQAGYFLARAEAAVTMEYYAAKGLASQTGGRVGGERSGAARRRKSEEAFGLHALTLANLLRAQRPQIGRDDLAADIQASWKLEGDPPKIAWLRSFLRAAERDGRVPKRAGQ